MRQRGGPELRVESALTLRSVPLARRAAIREEAEMFCVYDVEVLRGPDEIKGGWDNPEGMGFGTAVVYTSDTDIYHMFGPEDKEKAINLLSSGYLVVSFNGIKFDNCEMLGNENGLKPPWDNHDVMLEVFKSKFGVQSMAEAHEKIGMKTVHDGSCSLNGLSKGTLNMAKIGHGAVAPKQIQQGLWPEVYQYNLHDVRLTRRLFEFAATYHYLVDGNGEQIDLRPIL